jgi:monothiol glutaredoxin
VDYAVRNLLLDETLFDALCDFTDWPTSPQVFIDGKFVGGCDIVEDLYRSGELQKLVAGTGAGRA